MGVDVARFGNDKTIIIIRHGPRVIYIDELRKSDIVNTTGAVVTAALKYKVKNIIVDEIGVGAGVLDNLKNDSHFNATGFNGGNNPSINEKHLNLRAEVFDGLRQRFADGDITIPNDPELISQLASLTYRYNARGQLQLESKDQIRSSGRQNPAKTPTKPTPSPWRSHPTSIPPPALACIFTPKEPSHASKKPEEPTLNGVNNTPLATRKGRHVGAVREPPLIPRTPTIIPAQPAPYPDTGAGTQNPGTNGSGAS